MYADRYAKSGIKPGSLTVAIALNGAMLAALIFSAPELIPIASDPGFRIENIPLDAPPPKPDPAPPPKPQPRDTIPQPAPQPAPPQHPDVTPIGPSAPTGPVFDSAPPVADGTAIGGTGTVAYDPPRPAPVLTGAMIDPRFAASFQPTYPAAERRAGREGRVVVRIRIGTDGRVRQVVKISATSDAFFAVTEQRALGQWRFTPAMRDGVAIEEWKTISLRFQLEDS